MELIDEIQFHKSEFFETALIDCVEARETSAVIFANKTFNRDRGYGASVDIRGNIHHTTDANSAAVDLLELSEYLSQSAKTELLDALRKREEKKKLASSTRVLPITDPISTVAAQISYAANRDNVNVNLTGERK
jgi:hypothetical protein